MFIFLTITWLVAQIVVRMSPSFNFQLRVVVLWCCQQSLQAQSKSCFVLFPLTVSISTMSNDNKWDKGLYGDTDQDETCGKAHQSLSVQERTPSNPQLSSWSCDRPIMSYLGQDACEELISHRKSYLYFWKAFMSLAFLRRR